MTTRQRITILADWWPAACRSQSWDKNDRSLRLRVISEAIGRQIESMGELNNSDDIDQVKAYLKHLADDIDGTAEMGNRDPGDRRRYTWLIRRHGRALGGEPYIRALARDRFHLTAGLATWDMWEKLDTEQLHQLMMTLWARLVAKRRAGRNASLTSEETFPDQVVFEPETVAQLENEPF
jgi:hypothetical protein